MKTTLTLTIGLMLTSTLCHADHNRGPKQDGKLRAEDPIVSLEAFTHPGFFLRHWHHKGVLHPAKPHDYHFAGDSRFIMRPGLAGTGVSFESTNYPDHFLRHWKFRIVLSKYNPSPSYAEDATFVMHPGLAGYGTSFESLNYPGNFIRHHRYYFGINTIRGVKQFAHDATFNIIEEGGCNAPGPRRHVQRRSHQRHADRHSTVAHRSSQREIRGHRDDFGPTRRHYDNDYKTLVYRDGNGAITSTHRGSNRLRDELVRLAYHEARRQR